MENSLILPRVSASKKLTLLAWVTVRTDPSLETSRLLGFDGRSSF